jgi:tetratricopeptide (TPR) repeat protein/S1-C subfamily serine protease
MKPAVFLLTSLLLTHIFTRPVKSLPIPVTNRIAQADLNDDTLTPQQVQQTAKNITVRVTAENNGGSGVIIAQKGNNYLILTNAHVVKRATRIEIQAPDGQKYRATPLDGGFDSKYDLALLQFTSQAKYTLANLSSVSGSPLEPERTIYSAGFPFDSKNIRITTGQISQLSDIPFNDGTQIGYVTNKGEKGIRQGMSGGAIFDAQGNLLGVNTVGVAPILPDYTYNDGSKPIAKLKAQYRQANWGIPVYNFLTHVKADILYGYDNLPKVEHQVTPTGYMANLNIRARQVTVRIENSNGNGSGVIVARQGNNYYVLTAKHVIQNPETKQTYTNPQIVTYDQDRRNVNSTVVAEGADLAVVKFNSSNNYPVAKLGEYSQNTYDLVFVGGFPGRLNIKSPLWQWQLNPGFVQDREQGKLSTQDNQSFANGYDLIYSSISYGGMSGGPVFDTNGTVIGIHGKTESTDLNSLGISIQTFIGLAAKLQVAPNLLNIVGTNPLGLNPTDGKNVIAAMQNIPQPQLVDNGERWLAYGNQLYRTRQFDRAVLAFDRAIAKNQRLLGNYGKALSLWSSGKYQLAENAIVQAIAITPQSELTKYYYFWKYESFIFQGLEKYDEALKALDIATQLEPRDLTLLTSKALILSKKTQYLEAISIYTEIIRKQPEAYAYSNRGNAKLALGNKQEAIIDYDRAISLNPKYAVAYNNRGNAKYALGNKQEAVIDLDRAIILSPRYPGAYNSRCGMKLALGNKEAAIADCDRAIALSPKYPNPYVGRGDAKLALGNKEAAIADYDRAIALNPKFANAYVGRGNAKLALGNKEAAIADYDQAIALSPKYPNPYNGRGNAKLALGNKEAAIADYDRAIALSPKYANAYNGRGNAKLALADKQGAILDYNRSIQIDPNYAYPYANRGNVELLLGDKQKAMLDCDRAIQIDPKFAYAYSIRGNVKSTLGNKEAAIIDYDRAITLEPKLANAYNSRSVLKFELGDNSAAMIDLDRAIAINPNFASAYRNRGFMKVIIGRERDALPDLDRAIKLDPNIGESYACRGFIREMFGDKQGAISDYRQAIQVEPQSIQKWRKQAELVRTHNTASYQKYQQMIQKLEAGVRFSRS